jgi:hypothetical protein
VCKWRGSRLLFFRCVQDDGSEWRGSRASFSRQFEEMCSSSAKTRGEALVWKYEECWALGTDDVDDWEGWMCSGVCEGWNEDGVKATKAWCANINYLKGYMRVRNLNAFQTKSCTHETKPLCDQKPKDPSECFQQATSFRSCLCHRLTRILQRCRSQLSRARSKRQAIRPRSSNAAHIHHRPESLT